MRNFVITVNGKTYSSPVDNGKAIITIPDLEYGNYTLPVTYSGDDKYNPLTKDNDDLYDYDVVEVFISFKQRKDEYFEYELSPFGMRFKGLIINKTLKDPMLTRVEPDFEYEVNKTETGYNAIISLDVSKIDNFDINKIYFNCFAIDVDGQSDYQNLYALNPTLSNTFHLSSFLSKLEK